MVAEQNDQKETRSSHWEELGEDTSRIIDVRREIATKEGPFERFSKVVGRVLGSATFFALLLLSHALWIVLNLNLWPWRPIDPYPFVFLATIASVEAPFITLLILINQRRHRQIEDVREEIELKVSMHAERQMSMVIRMLDEIRKSQGIRLADDDEYIEKMGRDLDPEALAETVEREEEDADD